METFLTNFKFIIGFIVLVFLVQLAFGEKMSERFTLLTLFTMVILNAESFGTFLKDTFSVSEMNTNVDYTKTGANGMPSDVANKLSKI